MVVESIIALGGITLGLTTLLAIADRRLQVAEDPRLADVEALLPGTNCGACGYPGCRAFAGALVAGAAAPAGCSVSSDAGRARIARYLGVGIGEALKRVARLACAGGSNVARQRAHAVGLSTCAAAALAGGGAKGCSWGCLGLGDCEVACGFDALHLDRHGLPVVDEAKCTACGDCVDGCPKNLFSIQPAAARLWVACAAKLGGDAILAECEVACTGCSRCAMDAPGLVTMIGGFPVVDLTRPADDRAIERCPTGAIVWLDADRGPRRGAAAPRFHRDQPRPIAPA